MLGGRKISRLLSWITLGIVLVSAVVVPLGFFNLSYQYMAGNLEIEAKMGARTISRVISSNPDMWEFEPVRLGEFLARGIHTGYEETRLILNINKEVVVESATKLALPVMERRADLRDSGVVVGQIVIRRSLRPLVKETLFVGAASAFVGIVLFLFIRTIPIRTLMLKEDALQQSEEKYRDLFENANDAIFLTDTDYHITDSNAEAVKMLGYSREEMRDMKLFDLLTPETTLVSDFSSGGTKLAGAGAKYFGKAKTKGGDILEVEVSSSRILSEEKVKGSRNIVRDTTERNRMEKEMLRTQNLESIGVLAGGIAHDFNNILTAILGNISMAKLYLGHDDKAYERMVEAEKASRRAQDLTHQLLTFSRGGAPIKKTSSIVQIIKDSAGFALRGSNIRCELVANDDILPVDIDEGQMSQVMNNLLINADQAMPEGGIILVTAENAVIGKGSAIPLQPGNYIRLTIEDHGIGIPKDHLQKIFDPYFTTKERGSGLGLAVTFSIIKRHDGYITVRSELGEGTTFTIFLPASRKQMAGEATEKEILLCRGGRVLLMDDETTVRNIAGDMLRNCGHKVEFAKDGAETVSLYRKAMESGEPFDLVIMDLTIPGGMGGKETIKELLALDPSVKAIVSSGYSTDPIISDYKNYGFADFLVKPYTVQDLNQVVSRTLRTASPSRS